MFMTLSRIISLVMFLTTCGLLSAQTIKISDDSPLGSPVSLKGAVSFGDSDSVNCSITGHNRSSKAIITLAVELKLNKPSGEPGELQFERDHFFKELTISSPRVDFPITSDCQMGHEADIPRLSAPPDAHAKLLFVQYEDGSSWGDRRVASQLLAERLTVLEFLQSLRTAYSVGGPEKLTDALSKDQQPGTMVWSKMAGLRMIRDGSGVKAVADAVDKNLATAEARKSALLK
jgi:hypothetical protein